MKMTKESREKHTQSHLASRRCCGLPESAKKRQYGVAQYCVAKRMNSEAKRWSTATESGRICPERGRRIGTVWQKTVVGRFVPVKEMEGKPIEKILVRPASPSNIC